MTYENETFTLSVKEFNSLQEQIVKLKTKNFELTQKSMTSQNQPNPNNNTEQLQKLVDRQQKLRKANLKLQNEGKEWKKQAQLLSDKLDREKNGRNQLQKEIKSKMDKLKSDLNSSWKKKLDGDTDMYKKQLSEIKERHKLEMKRMKQLQKESEKIISEKDERFRGEAKKLEGKFKYQRGEYEKVLSDLKEKYRSEMKKVDTKFKFQQKEHEKSNNETKEMYEARISQREREMDKLVQESNERIRNEQRKQETIVKQQQQKNERLMVEYREKLVNEKKQMEQKFLHQQKEDEKVFNYYKKKEVGFKKEKEEARFQVNELNRIIVKLRKDLKDKDNQIIVLNKKANEIDALRGELRLEKEKLSKTHEFLEREKSEVGKLSTNLTLAKKQEKKIKKENQEKFQNMRKIMRSNEREIESLSLKYIHHIVKDSLSKISIKVENEEKKKYIRLYRETEEKCKDFRIRHKEIESQVKSLEVNLEDSKIESDISQKQNKQLIRELKSHLKVQRFEFSKKKKRLENEKRELVSKIESYERGSDMEGIEEMRNRPPSVSSSVSSSPSLKKKDSFTTPSPSPRKTPTNNIFKGDPGGRGGFVQLKKDNTDLIRKMTYMQKSNWNLEDRLKILQNKVFEREEEIEKKQNIIRDYMMRERLGRLSPMQEMKYKNNSSPDSPSPGLSSPGIIRGLFSKKKKPVVNPNLGFSRMQKVLEETILKNIQLHENMKIMGEEVARLMEENKKLKNQKLNSIGKLK